MKGTAQQQENTRNFIRSFVIRKAFEQVSGYDESEDMRCSADLEKRIRKGVSPGFEPNIEVGQIRIIPELPEYVPVVVLREWPEGWLIAPFSAYDFPANAQELVVGNHGLHAHVVQVWNARTYQDKILARSWVCGRASEEELKDIFDLWANSLDGRELRPELVERTGAVLDEPDERIKEYMSRSLDVFAELDAEDMRDILEGKDD